MPDSSLVRIVVTEDEPLVRKGVVTVLQEGGFEVVGVAVDATDLVRKVDQRKPDVVGRGYSVAAREHRLADAALDTYLTG